MIKGIIVATIAYLAMAVVCAWIFVQCYKDSKDDFKLAFHDLKAYFKKKKAD
jgi:hypothetical protein